LAGILSGTQVDTYGGWRLDISKVKVTAAILDVQKAFKIFIEKSRTIRSPSKPV
jgi:hypothetical protein